MVDEERRAAVLAEVVSNLGPSDGTVVSTPLTGPSTLKLTEDVVGAITSRPDHISSFCLVFYVWWTQIHYIRIGIRIQTILPNWIRIQIRSILHGSKQF